MPNIPDEYSNEDLVWLYDFEYIETYDIPLYIECARRFGTPVLELGSGTGRVSIPLAEAGFEVVGLEASPLLIDLCRKKMAFSLEAQLPISIVKADMAEFDLGKTYPLIIIPINTFLILDHKGQQSCLECCRKHLADGGSLVIDVFNPFGPSRNLVEANKTGGAEKLFSTRPHPQTGLPVNRYVSQKADIPNQQVYIDNVYEEQGEKSKRRWSFTEKLRFVYSSELEVMLNEAGLEIFRILGWYDGRPFDQSSEQMIFIARAVFGLR